MKTNEPLVLVVDDEDEWQENIKKLFYSNAVHVQIIPASCAEETLKIIKDHSVEGSKPIKLIILDMRIPWEKGGIAEPEGAKQLLPMLDYCLINASVPIIIFTGYPDYDDCIECIKAGAYYYLPKTESTKNRSKDLIDYTKRALSGDDYSTRLPSKQWLNQHWIEIQSNFGGENIAIIPNLNISALELHGVNFKVIGNNVIVYGESFNKVRDQIIGNKILREARPIISYVKQVNRSVKR